MTVPAYELEVGDEIAYSVGGGLLYGAIVIESITKGQLMPIILTYGLPVGARAQSTETSKILISWKGNTPQIEISQSVAFSARIMIRRKE